MTSRTFPLSRQRRRRIVNKPPPVPFDDTLSQSPSTDDHELGDELEHRSDDASDESTEQGGARPAAARLPHEHDEYTDPPAPTRDVIEQGHSDIASGQQDTDLRNRAAHIIDRNKPGRGR
ncbi:MAG TPA: hypothetical protein VNG69_18590 [Casimicrobiaceae bacterium]|nr:hypothetical protein [Casimicrobiaceae bacterium]